MNIENLCIREATISDAEIILDFRRKIYHESDFLLNYPDEFYCSKDDQIEFLKKTEKRDSGCFLIALVNNKVLGTVSISWNNKRKLRHYAELGVTVLKKYWNHGIGTLLIQKILEIANECSITKINIEVTHNNNSAIHLYKKCGFCEEGMKTKVIKIDNQYINMLIMGKEIL